MTHADLRERLGAYADGTLEDDAAELVRIHLATGCPECLRDVFTRPVGLPRPPVVVRRSGRLLVAAAVAGAAALGLTGGLVVAQRARSDGAADPRLEVLAQEVARLRAERDRAEADARRRIDELEARVAQARVAQTGAPPASPPPTDRPAGAPPTEAPAAAAEPGEAELPGWAAAVLASEGGLVVPLGPGEGAAGGSGFAVWSRERGTVVVSASNLPLAGPNVFYRVRVTMADGSTAWVGDVVASPRRDLVIGVELPETRVRVDRVDLYRDPPGMPVLTARLGP